MPAIYTDEWYRAMFELANSQDAISKKMPQGQWRFALEVEGDGISPYIPVGEIKHFYLRFVDGKAVEYHEAKEKIPGKELDYRVTGPAHIFEGVAAGQLDFVEMGLKGTITIRGDMRLLMQNSDMINVMFEIYSQSDITEWPKGKPPY
jgi:hypothetical protein